MRGSAFKRTLAELPLQTPVNFRGPLGSFPLPQDAATPIVLIAGGIGVTPFRSMIKNVTEEKFPHKVTLIYSNRTPQDAPFLDEPRRWEGENPNFRFIPTMTKPEVSKQPWTGRAGHIDAAFLRTELDNPDRFISFVAGPTAMVDAVAKALVEAGASEDRIRTEEFSGY